MKNRKNTVMFGLCFDLLKGAFQLIKGAWKISKLSQPIVTIFGGARLPQESEFAKKAHDLSHKLIQQDISIITGGGPGIMRAASCGATHEQQKLRRAKSIGIAVKGLDFPEKKALECAQEYYVMDYFFARKWLMINYSVAFAVFPGGFGTVDEFSEVITLIQTKKLPGVPVVLIGINYWKPFMQWATESALKHGLVSEDDINLIRITDDIDEALSLLKERCEVCNMPVKDLKEKKEL